jgi:hypothetical protein
VSAFVGYELVIKCDGGAHLGAGNVHAAAAIAKAACQIISCCAPSVAVIAAANCTRCLMSEGRCHRNRATGAVEEIGGVRRAPTEIPYRVTPRRFSSRAPKIVACLATARGDNRTQYKNFSAMGRAMALVTEPDLHY